MNRAMKSSVPFISYKVCKVLSKIRIQVDLEINTIRGRGEHRKKDSPVYDRLEDLCLIIEMAKYQNKLYFDSIVTHK